MKKYILLLVLLSGCTMVTKIQFEENDILGTWKLIKIGNESVPDNYNYSISFSKPNQCTMISIYKEGKVADKETTQGEYRLVPGGIIVTIPKAGRTFTLEMNSSNLLESRGDRKDDPNNLMQGKILFYQKDSKSLYK